MELAGDVFNLLEEAIHQHFLPALFNVLMIPEDLRDLMALPVWQGGLGALNPTKEADPNRAISEACTRYLKEVSLGLCIFEGDQHLACLKHGRLDGKKRREEKYESERGEIEQFYIEDRFRSVERAGKAMNNWLTVVPCTANNFVLNREEFCDQVLMQHIITPKGLPTILACNKCPSLKHTLQCKIGGLIGGRHNNTRDDLGCVATQAISPHVICNYPRVQPCWESNPC
eukprot:11580395-Ditylum_brightwellii.AAC.1